MTVKNTTEQPLSAKAIRLYKIAGWSLLGICLLHFVFWIIYTRNSLPVILSGELWEITESPETIILHFHFWALWGSFMLPLLLLSLLIVRAGKKQDRLPAYVGWSLLIWIAACCYMLPSSGFWLALVPGILLVLVNRRKAL